VIIKTNAVPDVNIQNDIVKGYTVSNYKRSSIKSNDSEEVAKPPATPEIESCSITALNQAELKQSDEKVKKKSLEKITTYGSIKFNSKNLVDVDKTDSNYHNFADKKFSVKTDL
jgi:hypothetical protein